MPWKIKSYTQALAMSVLVLSLLTSCQDEGIVLHTASPTIAVSASPTPTSLLPSLAPSSARDSENTAIQPPLATFSYWLPLPEAAYKVISTANENRVFQTLEQKQRIHIDFIHPQLGKEWEALSTLLASDALPDCIEIGKLKTNYSGGVDKMIEKGLVVRLNDLLETNAPNYAKVLAFNNEIRKTTTSLNGNVWGFLSIQTQEQLPTYGPIIRQDWLDELQLPMPETVDDWHEMLVTFRDKKGAKTPLLLPTNGVDGVTSGYWLAGAYGVGSSFTLKEGKVIFGPAEEAYKTFLITMRAWYQEGLIDPEFAKRDGAGQNELIYSSSAGAWCREAANADGMVYAEKLKDVLSFNPRPAPLPVLQKSDTRHLRLKQPHVRGYDTVITSACKDVPTLMKWFDYRYSEEGAMLFNYGILGENYNMWGETPVFANHRAENPDALPLPTLWWKYKMPEGAYLRYPLAVSNAPGERALQASALWEAVDASEMLPPLELSEGQTAVTAKIMGGVNACVNRMNVAIITGESQIETWEKEVMEMKILGLKEAIGYYQTALERYMED